MVESEPNNARLAAAFCKAQQGFKSAVKDSVNPHFHSRYASLGSIWDAVKEALGHNGLSVIQLPVMVGDMVGIETILLHTSGESIGRTYALAPDKPTPQGIGSAITYTRRYALAALLGIVADEDDDGEAATGRGGNSKAQPAAPAPRPKVVLPLDDGYEAKAEEAPWGGEFPQEVSDNGTQYYGSDALATLANGQAAHIMGTLDYNGTDRKYNKATRKWDGEPYNGGFFLNIGGKKIWVKGDMPAGCVKGAKVRLKVHADADKDDESKLWYHGGHLEVLS